MRIFVAIPTYDGKLPIQTVKCLMDELLIAREVGDEIITSFLPACSVVAAGRNQLVEEFLETDCDKIFFLDADVTFNHGDLLKIARKPEDFIGGAYRFKSKNTAWPVMFLDKPELWANENGLLEVETLPTGFMALSRNVFTKFREKWPDRYYKHQGKDFYAYFQMVYADGEMHSDDTYFCKEWRQLGGKVWLEPEATLTHWCFNPTPYAGHIGNWLKLQHAFRQELNKKEEVTNVHL